VSLRTIYSGLGQAARLSERAAAEIVEAARPHALAALGRTGQAPASLAVSARCVDAAAARGGNLIPAWPIRRDDGSVVIEFVEDWGVLLAAWRAGLAEPADEMAKLDALIKSRERIWIGIANDVLQLYVADPPPGTYSMVRHHALMLVAATLWLGAQRARRWRRAHAFAARAFLRRLDGRPLWATIEHAEHELQRLLDDPRGKTDAERVVTWLDNDVESAAAYQTFLGAASLSIAALLDVVPDRDPLDWLRRVIAEQHVSPDFNRTPIEQFVRGELP